MGLFSDIVGGIAGAVQGFGSGGLAGALVGGLGGGGVINFGPGTQFASVAPSLPVMAAAPRPAVPAPRPSTSPAPPGTPSVVGALLRTVAQRMGVPALTLTGLMGFVRKFGAPWLIGAAYVTANELLYLMNAHQHRARRRANKAYSITASQMRKTRSTIRKLHRMHCLLREVASSAGSGGYVRSRRSRICRPKKKICA